MMTAEVNVAIGAIDDDQGWQVKQPGATNARVELDHWHMRFLKAVHKG
jgi:hypothetical protein